MEMNKVAVCAIVFKGEKILGVTRRNKPNHWGLPGGKVENNETLRQALIREVKEETDLDVVYSKLIFSDEDDEGWTTFCYLCGTTGEPKVKEEGIGVAYILFDDLLVDHAPFKQYNTKLWHHLMNLGDILLWKDNGEFDSDPDLWDSWDIK